MPRALLVGETPYEINVARSESVVEKVNRFDLHAAFGRASETAAAGAVPAAGRAVTVPLWPYCAAAAALLFLLETFVCALLDRRELVGRQGGER